MRATTLLQGLFMKLILKGTRDSWTGIVAEVIDMGAYEIPAPLIVNSTMSPSALLQANHQMVPVTVDVSVANSCDSSSVDFARCNREQLSGKAGWVAKLYEIVAHLPNRGEGALRNAKYHDSEMRPRGPTAGDRAFRW